MNRVDGLIIVSDGLTLGVRKGFLQFGGEFVEAHSVGSSDDCLQSLLG
jgi:hypothetical protein